MKPKNSHNNKNIENEFSKSQSKKQKIYKSEKKAFKAFNMNDVSKFDFYGIEETDMFSVKENNASKKAVDINDIPKLDYHGTNAIDALQAKVNNAGKKALSTANKERLIDKKNKDIYETAAEELGKNADFKFNIGFAGEQSAGKSMVIDSLIEYPLMPTCNLPTTSSSVRLEYGEKVRIIATDDDTNKQVFDLDCTKVTTEQFNKLKEYAILAMRALIVENLQYFTDKDVLEEGTSMTVEDIKDMNSDDPKQVALLCLILLAVYIGQNAIALSKEKLDLLKKRGEYLRYFGVPEDAYNLSVVVYWNNEFLKSGFVITDLPGLGATAGERNVNGKIIKSHDDITCEAISKTDAMVFIVDATVKEVGIAAVDNMIETLKKREAVDEEKRIIPVLNKCEGFKTAQLETTKVQFAELLAKKGLKIEKDEILPYAAICGEYMYNDIPKERLLYIKKLENDYQKLKKDYDEKSHIEELKDFFRKVYIETGKNAKALDAVHSIRTLAETSIGNLDNAKKSNEKLVKSRDDTVKEITKQLEKVLESETANQLKKLTNEARYLDKKKEGVQEGIQEITHMYIFAFEAALKSYKDKISEILPKFDLYMLGNKARIDRYGTANYNLYYNELCPALQSMNIDVSHINQSYTDILESMNSSILDFYDNAVSQLDSFKNNVKEAIEQSVLHIKGEKKDDITNQYRDFAKIVVEKVEIEIKSAKLTSEILKKEVKKVGKSVAADLINANESIVNEFADGTTSSVKSKVAPGWFRESREYITIYGSGGVKEIIDNLSLTENEKAILLENVEAVCADKILNSINGWFDKAYEITGIYANIHDETQDMLHEINNNLTKDTETLEKKIKNTKAQVKKWENILSAFNDEIKDALNNASSYMQNAKKLIN